MRTSSLVLVAIAGCSSSTPRSAPKPQDIPVVAVIDAPGFDAPIDAPGPPEVVIKQTELPKVDPPIANLEVLEPPAAKNLGARTLAPLAVERAATIAARQKAIDTRDYLEERLHGKENLPPSFRVQAHEAKADAARAIAAAAATRTKFLAALEHERAALTDDGLLELALLQLEHATEGATTAPDVTAIVATLEPLVARNSVVAEYVTVRAREAGGALAPHELGAAFFTAAKKLAKKAAVLDAYNSVSFYLADATDQPAIGQALDANRWLVANASGEIQDRARYRLGDVYDRLGDASALRTWCDIPDKHDGGSGPWGRSTSFIARTPTALPAMRAACAKKQECPCNFSFVDEAIREAGRRDLVDHQIALELLEKQIYPGWSPCGLAMTYDADRRPDEAKRIRTADCYEREPQDAPAIADQIEPTLHACADDHLGAVGSAMITAAIDATGKATTVTLDGKLAVLEPCVSEAVKRHRWIGLDGQTIRFALRVELSTD